MDTSTNRKWVVRSLVLLVLTVPSCVLALVVAFITNALVVTAFHLSDLTRPYGYVGEWLLNILFGSIIGVFVASVGFIVIRKLLKPKAWPIFWLGTIAVAIVCQYISLVLVPYLRISPYPVLFINAGIAGLLVGYIQWTQLQEKPKLSLLWIPASMAGWVIAVLVFRYWQSTGR
jgi:hypothetical protein